MYVQILELAVALRLYGTLNRLNSVRPYGARRTVAIIYFLRVLLGFLLSTSLQTTEGITPDGLKSETWGASP